MAFEQIPKKDWYSILGADPSADMSDLKQKYQKLILMYHPDKQSTDVPAGTVEECIQKFIEIDQAWKILGNEETKKEYDLQRHEDELRNLGPVDAQVHLEEMSWNKGGGLAVGTVLLIEEDKYNIYSSVLFKYFLAEGLINGHVLLVASAKEDPADILQELPAPLLDDNYRKELDAEARDHQTTESNTKMKIAWRYQLLPKMEVGPVSSSRFGHYYDVSKRMPQELLEASKCHGFFLPQKVSSTLKVEPYSLTHGYTKLLQFIQNIIYEEGFDGSNPQNKQKNILRIGIQNLGSPLWGDDICCTENCNNSHNLTKFLYVLRGLLRTSLSACIITMPTHLIQNKAIISRVTNLSDTVVGLESFIGSERETNPLYKDYHGLIHIRQIPRLNNLICDESDVKDLAFKLKRKLFTIERLHLPPDLSDTVSRSSKQDLAESAKLLGPGCGTMAGGKKHLDF